MRTDTGQWTTAVVADSEGRIFELKGYAAVGMAGSELRPLKLTETIKVPFGSELMFLPQRRPILYHIQKKRLETLDKNPYQPAKAIFPVAVFNSPGYVATLISGYREKRGVTPLPLFSYGAVGWDRGTFRSSVMQVDRERRQDLRLMKEKDVYAGVETMRTKIPQNRLRQHLEKCAMIYGCPAGKNFFLGRYEAPLPTAETCNARCLGCLSLQSDQGICCSQERIGFTPSPKEIAEIALIHISRVKRSIVSFGQGWEGDPLLAAKVIEPAIRLIRAKTDQGTIHMNTNGSLPGVLQQLCAAGLDSVRISVNSMRSACYQAYFRPKGYTFDDVMKSMCIAKENGKHVAINYLNLPGFTDAPEEIDSLNSFLNKDIAHMIQWRNLNFDPLKYWRIMRRTAASGKPIGMQNLLRKIRGLFPKIKHGYFNPPKETF
jgi:pyruvate-formate lyase-activating enzyme